MDLKKDIFYKARSYLLDPKKAFEGDTKTDVLGGLKYAVIWLFISAILTSIIYALFGDLMLKIISSWVQQPVIPEIITAGSIIGVFFGTWIGGIIWLLILALWLHLWAYIVGARNGLENTLKTVFYGYTPSYILSWIPFISFIGAIWTLVLCAFGLNKLQNLTTGRAALAVIIAMILPVMLLVILAAAAFIALGGTAGMAVMPF
ncbi:MAG: YIP1 family protein [Candidatus Woesearchaeota archaeon]|nr:MAG: YIP1 family protein [Candidatus Woesearchaeota archaeon]